MLDNVSALCILLESDCSIYVRYWNEQNSCIPFIISQHTSTILHTIVKSALIPTSIMSSLSIFVQTPGFIEDDFGAKNLPLRHRNQKLTLLVKLDSLIKPLCLYS